MLSIFVRMSMMLDRTVKSLVWCFRIRSPVCLGGLGFQVSPSWPLAFRLYSNTRVTRKSLTVVKPTAVDNKSGLSPNRGSQKKWSVALRGYFGCSFYTQFHCFTCWLTCDVQIKQYVVLQLGAGLGYRPTERSRG